MTKLVWDSGLYESGLDRGVFYGSDGSIEPWNGLISVQESPSDSDDRVDYHDGLKRHNIRRPGNFAGTIEAFTYPASFHNYFSSRRQERFGFSYRTQTSLGDKIHVVYNVLTSPSERNYGQNEVEPLSWSFTTTPVAVPGAKATAHIIVEASQTNQDTLTELEALLYGTDLTEPMLPSPSQIIDLYESHATLRVTDHGDGTFTITGPDSAIQMVDATTFQITWPSAVYIDEETYTIRSL